MLVKLQVQKPNQGDCRKLLYIFPASLFGSFVKRTINTKQQQIKYKKQNIHNRINRLKLQ